MVSRPAIKKGNIEAKYDASKTELLLEEICESFGTELLQAYLDTGGAGRPYLVRESKPAVVEHPNGEMKVLQFQYTRFSPLHSSKAIEVYNQNRALEKRKREISHEAAWKEVYSQHEKWDAFKEVTDNEYLKNLKMHRREKKLYFAIYNIKNEEIVEEKLKPFLIYEHIKFCGNLPEAHITFHIEPFFVIGHRREDTKNIYDTIAVDFPQIIIEHGNCISSALSLHPLDNLRTPEQAFKRDNQIFTFNYKVHSLVPREVTMGFIQAYLRKHCLDRTLS